MKYMQIYVNKLEGLDAFISFSDNLNSIVAREKVSTLIKKNYTETPTGNYYLTLIPKSGTRMGDYEVDIDLNYYMYDPQCIQYTKWNGTDCVQQYDEYCKSLKPQYIEQLGTEDFEIVYNGTTCVLQMNNDVMV